MLPSWLQMGWVLQLLPGSRDEMASWLQRRWRTLPELHSALPSQKPQVKMSMLRTGPVFPREPAQVSRKFSAARPAAEWLRIAFLCELFRPPVDR